MERFCVSHDCHRLGCDVEMVQSNVGEWVGYDDASAEIAKLRAELSSEKEWSLSLTRSVDAAHAALGIGARDAVTIAEAVEALKRALSAARAALDGEMGHADLLAFTLDKAVGTRREAADAHRDRRARRAAEAQPKG